MSQLPSEDDVYDGGVNVFYAIKDVIKIGYVRTDHDFFTQTVAQLNRTTEWMNLKKIFGWFPEERSPNGKLWVSLWLESPGRQVATTQQKIETTKRKLRIAEDATGAEVEVNVGNTYEQ